MKGVYAREARKGETKTLSGCWTSVIRLGAGAVMGCQRKLF
jgi:hypothetical protein